MPLITQAIHFLIVTIFDLFITLILLRFIFQFIRPNFYHPLTQAIVKLTNPMVLPLRKIIPSVKSIDTASLILLISTCLLKLTLSCLIQYHLFPAIGGLLIWGIGDLLHLTLTLFFWSIIIQAVMSWISPYPNHPIYALLSNLTNPLTQPVKKYIKPISGIDLSPLVVLLGLQLLLMLIAAPLQQAGIAWAI